MLRGRAFKNGSELIAAEQIAGQMMVQPKANHSSLVKGAENVAKEARSPCIPSEVMNLYWADRPTVIKWTGK